MTKSKDELTELDFEDPMDWLCEVRRRISEKCGHSIDRLFEYTAESQRKAEARGHKVRSTSDCPPHASYDIMISNKYVKGRQPTSD